jgi:hypothetical protein
MPKLTGNLNGQGNALNDVRYELVAALPAPWNAAWVGRPIFVTTPGVDFGPWIGGTAAWQRPSAFGASSLEVAKNGVLIGTRKRLNLKEGANITLNMADDPLNDKVDAEIVAAGGGGGGATPQNILVNGTFILDPDPAAFSHSCGGGLLVPPPGGWRPQAPTVVAQMPGWALSDWQAGFGNDSADAWCDVGGGPPAPVIGPNMGVIYVNALDPGGGFDFYQALHPSFQYKPRARLYQGQKISFRCAVFANSPVSAFISHDGGTVVGTVHPGDGAWHVLYVQATVPDPSDYLAVGISLPAVDTVYIDACTCVAGVLDPALPFIAKPQADDLLAINSMLCSIQDENMLWAIPIVSTIPITRLLPVTMRDRPYEDAGGLPMPTPIIGVPPAAPPLSAPFFPWGFNMTPSQVTYSLDDPAAWAAAALPWEVIVWIYLDARPI